MYVIVTGIVKYQMAVEVLVRAIRQVQLVYTIPPVEHAHCE